MESTAKYLMQNASDIFDIYVYDITKRALEEENRRLFKADPGSLTINGSVNCLPGQAPNDGVCSKILFSFRNIIGFTSFSIIFGSSF
jgi:hypothetical protein